MQDKQEQFVKMICGSLFKDPSEISSETDLSGLDSLELLELGMAAEDIYGIEINDNEAVNVKTVGDLVKIIEDKSPSVVIDL